MSVCGQLLKQRSRATGMLDNTPFSIICYRPNEYEILLAIYLGILMVKVSCILYWSDHFTRKNYFTERKRALRYIYPHTLYV